MTDTTFSDDDIVMPALLRHARATYGLAMRRALARAGYDDIPKNGLYVIGGLAYARQVGATTVALSCNPASRIAEMADIAISPVVGPEVLAGSTRLKSGTAQKLVLNMLSTASMIRIGKSYENLMVDMRASNSKLVARAARIVMQATDCTAAQAEDALARCGNDLKLAVLVRLTGLEPDEGRASLAAANGVLRRAMAARPTP